MGKLSPDGDCYTDGARSYGRVTKVISEIISPNVIYPPGAAERGTYVHDMSQLIDAGRLDIEHVPPEFIGYAAAYEYGMKELYAWKIDPFSTCISEVPLKSEALGIAGTPDRYWPDEGVLLDLKSGVRVDANHLLQLAGYSLLLAEHGHKVKHWIRLYVADDGSHQLVRQKASPQWINDFRCVLRAWQIKKKK